MIILSIYRSAFSLNLHFTPLHGIFLALNLYFYVLLNSPIMLIQVLDIITSKYTHSGNLLELTKLSLTLGKIARIDRIPLVNTLSGARAIAYAWDAVDVCNHVASRMKVVTKVSYALLIILGILIGAITIVHMNLRAELTPEERGPLMSDSALNVFTTIFALINGVVAGIINILGPFQKWTRLRGAALAIESEIWQFRTRTGMLIQSYSLRTNCVSKKAIVTKLLI